MSRISGAESSVLAEHAEGMFSDYDRTFSGLSESHKTVINALCDCDWNLTKGKRWTFTSTEAADKLWFFINSGEFRLTFSKDEIVLFFVNNNIPMYPDWKARLEAVEKAGFFKKVAGYHAEKRERPQRPYDKRVFDARQEGTKFSEIARLLKIDYEEAKAAMERYRHTARGKRIIREKREEREAAKKAAQKTRKKPQHKHM